MGVGGGLIGILRAGCFAGVLACAGLGLNEMHRAAESRLIYNSLGVNGIERVLEASDNKTDLSYEIGLYHFNNAAIYLGTSAGLLFFGLLLPGYKKR